MASSTRYGGPSWTPEELADPDLPEVIIKRAELGYVDRKEEPSVGNSSNPSTEKPVSNDDSPSPTPRKPARTTGNRSKAQDKETDSVADSTDGVGQSNENQPSSDPFDF